MADISIPLLLKEYTNGSRKATVAGSTLAEIVAGLDAIYPGIEAKICDGEKLRPTLAFTVDGKIAAAGLDTPVGPDSQINILPSFGGG